jgi:isocitrate dehydrogenase
MKYNLVKNTPKEFKQIGQPDYKEEYSDVLFNFQRNNKLDKDKRIKLEKNHI